eukprot:PITA_02438
MANERLDKLETDMNELKNTLDELSSMVRQALAKGKEPALEDHYNDHVHHEGESSHSPHGWHTHLPPNRDLPPSQRPPKLDMQKFDGSNPSTWLPQMEQYFKLNRLQDDWTKIGVATIYLDSERWQWAEWHQLNEYITAFEALAFRTQHLSDEFYTECFISGLKEAIKAQVLLHHPPTWSEACQVARKVERAITAQYSRPNFPTKGRPPQAHTTTQTLKVQKVSPQEMAERRKQGLCYYCDEKYSPGHKCKEPKFFQIDATDYSSTEEDPPLEEQEAIEEDNQKEIVSDDPVISLNALAGISSPQTLKIRGFLKHRPVIVLIDSGSTHNFIHQKIAEAAHCFVRAVSNFQVQIVDGGTMKCEGRCENVKLQMGDYQLKTHMFAIHMGGCDIVLGAEWLRTIGPITMDFQELYMSFKQNNSTHILCGL